jgi:hypothetical protein
MNAIAKQFLEARPEENVEFILYCARRGWCSLPLVAMRKIAVEFMRRCVRKGWAKFPDKTAMPAPVPAPTLGFVCCGKWMRHRWDTMAGDRCTRCGTQFIGKKHASSKRSSLPLRTVATERDIAHQHNDEHEHTIPEAVKLVHKPRF